MRYIALLRGVNVGGKNIISMRDLKACFEEAGFREVETYINSGNVLFSCDETDATSLSARAGEIVARRFGFDAQVAVISAESLKEALDNAPEWWGDDPDSKHNAIFVIPPATAEEVIGEVGEAKPEYEKLYVHGCVILWSAPLKTFSRTQWSKVHGTKAYGSITIRNANTARKLLAIAIKQE